MTDEELVATRLQLRGEDIFLVPEDRPVCSWLSEKGYRKLSIPLGARGKKRVLRYGRVKFLLAYGRWPTEVEHADRNRGNDLLSNIGETTRLGNVQNRSAPKRALPLGVYKTTRGRGFQAMLRRGGKLINLGHHETVEQAATAVRRFKEGI